jgi:hypothetical protein
MERIFAFKQIRAFTTKLTKAARRPRRMTVLIAFVTFGTLVRLAGRERSLSAGGVVAAD